MSYALGLAVLAGSAAGYWWWRRYWQTQVGDKGNLSIFEAARVRRAAQAARGSADAIGKKRRPPQFGQR